jgi:hypothetical protein
MGIQGSRALIAAQEHAEQVPGLLLGTLYGAVTVSGAPGVAERIAASR